MKKSSRISLAIVLCSVRILFAQGNSNHIIFLTDYYKTFVSKSDAGLKNTDSIYKETVEAPIINNYFRKSEYAVITQQFFGAPIVNIQDLKKSIELINANRNLITAKINSSLQRSRQHLQVDSLTIYIIPVNPANKDVISSMDGIMGLTAGSKQIIITIEPAVNGWENMLEYGTAHEFSHAYWTLKNFGKSEKWTLLDYLVFEGRGDYFAHLLYPNVSAPWTKVLTEKKKKELWDKIEPELQREDFSYQAEVMFGSLNFPVWGGYSLGYSLVEAAVRRNKDWKLSEWMNMESNEIAKQAGYLK